MSTPDDESPAVSLEQYYARLNDPEWVRRDIERCRNLSMDERMNLLVARTLELEKLLDGRPWPRDSVPLWRVWSDPHAWAAPVTDQG